MTNFEKIKNMSIEEFAKFLADFEICHCCFGCDEEYADDEVGCEKGVKLWLEN